MLKTVLRAPNYGIRLAQCIIIEWIYRYNLRISRDRANMPRPHHYDIRLIDDIQTKCDQLGVPPSFDRWELPPDADERFALLWQRETALPTVTPGPAIATPTDNDADPILEENFEAALTGNQLEVTEVCSQCFARFLFATRTCFTDNSSRTIKNHTELATICFTSSYNERCN